MWESNRELEWGGTWPQPGISRPNRKWLSSFCTSATEVHYFDVFLSQLRWLPFTIPKTTEKKVDFVAVSLTHWCHVSFWWKGWLMGIVSFCSFVFACCRVFKPSVVLGMPNLATVLPSTCTPATAPCLTGECVRICKRFPSYTKCSFSQQHAKENLWLHSDNHHSSSFFLVLAASTTQMETFWLVRK